MVQSRSSTITRLWCWPIKDVFPSNTHSISPPVRGTKVIVIGTSEHIFLKLHQLKFCLKNFRKNTSEITLLNLHWHRPILHAHSTTCCWTPFSMRSVLYSKIYFLETSSLEIHQRTGPAPWFPMFHTVTIFASSPSSSLHNC